MNSYNFVENLRKTFRSNRTRSYDWRVAQLNGLKRLLVEKDSDINEALWQDLRKGVFESQISEQGLVVNEIEHAIRHLSGWMKPQSARTPLIAQPGHSEIRSDPYGVVLIIGAWNYPINLLLAPLVGALSGGNAVVLKPSELAPATSGLMAKLIPQYLDPDAVVVFEGGIPETDHLLDCIFDYIFFTGSSTVGRIIMRKAAENLTPVTLELGGKSPAIVMGDADIAVAARRIAWGKFLNAGQTCIAPDYVLVHSSVENAFLSGLKHAIQAFYGEDPEKSPDYCRIVNDRNFARLEKFLNDGRRYCGGKINPKTRYIEPTVLQMADGETSVMKEEIFGPILPVLPIQSADEAIEFVNQRPKPLALYLFSSDHSISETILDQTSSGGVCINDVVIHMPSPHLPFGGVGASGMGRYHGRNSFDTFTHQKGVMKKMTWGDVPIRYPPYSMQKLKWMLRLS